jgi:hypothetical protein
MPSGAAQAAVADDDIEGLITHSRQTRQRHPSCGQIKSRIDTCRKPCKFRAAAPVSRHPEVRAEASLEGRRPQRRGRSSFEARRERAPQDDGLGIVTSERSPDERERHPGCRRPANPHVAYAHAGYAFRSNAPSTPRCGRRDGRAIRRGYRRNRRPARDAVTPWRAPPFPDCRRCRAPDRGRR